MKWMTILPWCYGFIAKYRCMTIGYRRFSSLCFLVLVELGLWVLWYFIWQPSFHYNTLYYGELSFVCVTLLTFVVFHIEHSWVEVALNCVIWSLVAYTHFLAILNHKRCSQISNNIKWFGEEHAEALGFYVFVVQLKMFEIIALILPGMVHSKLHDRETQRKTSHIFRLWTNVALVMLRMVQMQFILANSRQEQWHFKVGLGIAIYGGFDLMDRTYLLPSLMARIFRNDHILQHADDSLQRTRLRLSTFHIPAFVVGMFIVGTGLPLVGMARFWAAVGMYLGSTVALEYVVIEFNRRLYLSQGQSMSRMETLKRLLKYPLQNLGWDTVAPTMPEETLVLESQVVSQEYIMVFSYLLGLSMAILIMIFITIQSPCMIVPEELCGSQNAGIIDALFMRKCHCAYNPYSACWDAEVS